LAIVRRFRFRRRHVTDGLQQPSMIEPVDPYQRRVLDLVEAPPEAAAVGERVAMGEFGVAMLPAVAIARANSRTVLRSVPWGD